MTPARLLPVAVVAGLAALVGVGVWLLSTTPASLVNEEPPTFGPTPGAEGDVVTVAVEEGDSAREIGERLEEAGVIESGRLFRVLVALMGLEDELAEGEYEFERGETTLNVIDRIAGGVTASRVVTIPEGLRSEEIGELLERRGVLSAAEFRQALQERNYAGLLPGLLPPGASWEGFLFPATYGLSRNVTGRDVVQQMLAAFEERVMAELPPLDTLGRPLRDIVILASIVEREARLPTERSVIASVFVNRLALGLPLQADPTVQYALGSDLASVARFGYWKRELTAADLLVPSPYNTYVNVGLPPGPIANPGLDAILAVVRPARTNYLFFVARPDGSHVFAQTLEEHRRNVCQIDPTRPECATPGGAP